MNSPHTNARSLTIVALAFILAGCATSPPSSTSSAASTCAGEVALPTGAKPVQNEALLKRAVAVAGQGGMCKAVVAQLGSEPLVLHRAWDAQRNSAVGAWWSFWWPSGAKDAFRAGYAVCPEWSALNRIIRCTLKPGSTIVVGTTQSADCANVTLPATATLQVFLADPDRDLDRESCHAYAWE